MIRFLDVIFSIVLLILLSPVLLLVCVWNLLTGEGEVFYRQLRAGQNGRHFHILKFATMIKNSPKIGSKLFVEKNDIRLLPLGSFLRRSKINELPQLLNVLKGEMSLVGFRPLVPETFARANVASKCAAYSMLPGLTGVASIINRNEEQDLAGVADREQVYFEVILPKKTELDDWWAEHCCVKSYVLILTLTAISMNPELD